VFSPVCFENVVHTWVGDSGFGGHVGGDGFVEFFCSRDELICHGGDLALHVVLGSLDQNSLLLLLNEEALLFEVLVHAVEGAGFREVVGLAEGAHVITGLLEACLDLVQVKQGLSVNLVGVGSEEDVALCLTLHL